MRLKQNLAWLNNTLSLPDALSILYKLLVERDNKLMVFIDLEKNNLNELLLGQYLYLESILKGFENTLHYAHIIVDEAQDLNIFEYGILKHLNRTYVFTIVGDLNQGIKSYRGIDDWSELSSLAPKHKTIYS